MQTLPLSVFAVAVLIASIPLQGITTLPAIGSIARLIGVMAAGVVLLESFAGPGFRPMHMAHGPLALFVIWSGWSCFWSVNQGLTADRLTTNVQLLLMMWLIWQAAPDRRALAGLLKGLVNGSCIAVFLTYLNARNLAAVDRIRYAGAGADPNQLGLTFVIAMPMAYYLAGKASSRAGYIAWLAAIPLLGAGVLFTVSRGAFIAMMVALLGISIWHAAASSRLRMAPLLVAALLLSAGLTLMPKTTLQRLASIEDEVSSGRVGSRTGIWRIGLEMFERRPAAGIGAATFGYAVEPFLGTGLVAHNVYVSVLTETGVIGFLIFLLALATLFITALQMGLAERCLWLLLMVIWCIGAVSLTLEAEKITWVVFSLLISTAGVAGSRSYRFGTPLYARAS